MELPQVKTGKQALQDYLQRNEIDFQTFDPKTFQQWAFRQIQRRKNDQTFQARCEVRDLRKQHHNVLSFLEGYSKETQERYEKSENYQQIEKLKREQHSAEQALQGIKEALKKIPSEKREALKNKLKSFKVKQKQLAKDLQKLSENCPQKRSFEKTGLALQHFKTDIGLVELEKKERHHATQQGKFTGKAGFRFEDVGQKIVEEIAVPFLCPENPADPSIRVLSHVTMGIAKAEFDNMVIRIDPQDPKQPVEVLAMVEVKRNINDLGSGFTTRQENLAFLLDDKSKYDPSEYRTKVFQKGVFDRPAFHKQGEETYTFDQSSFRNFPKDPNSGHYIENLFLICDQRPLQGLGASEYSKLMFRLSTDRHYNPKSIEYFERLLDWLKGILRPIQSHHVIKWFMQKERWANQLIMVPRK